MVQQWPKVCRDSACEVAVVRWQPCTGIRRGMRTAGGATYHRCVWLARGQHYAASVCPAPRAVPNMRRILRSPLPVKRLEMHLARSRSRRPRAWREGRPVPAARGEVHGALAVPTPCPMPKCHNGYIRSGDVPGASEVTADGPGDQLVSATAYQARWRVNPLMMSHRNGTGCSDGSWL